MFQTFFCISKMASFRMNCLQNALNLMNNKLFIKLFLRKLSDFKKNKNFIFIKKIFKIVFFVFLHFIVIKKYKRIFLKKNKIMKYLKWVPNFLTSMSVFMGSLAIVTSYQGDEYLIYSALFIAIAAVFDFSDGFAARMLKAGSEMGKELDSLADMVSFGVAPALLMHHLVRISLFGENAAILFSEMTFLEWIYVFLPFSIAIFSALRLAKFNIDTRQTSSFIGMPTPAGAISVIALVVVYHYFNESFIFTHLTSSVWFLLIYSVVVSGLLVSELPMFSLKAKNLKWKDNSVRFVFLILLAILFIVFKGLAIVFFIPLYLVMSIINHFSVK